MSAASRYIERESYHHYNIIFYRDATNHIYVYFIKHNGNGEQHLMFIINGNNNNIMINWEELFRFHGQFIQWLWYYGKYIVRLKTRELNFFIQQRPKSMLINHVFLIRNQIISFYTMCLEHIVQRVFRDNNINQDIK